MKRHPINRVVRDANDALFDLYAARQRPGRIRAMLADLAGVAALFGGLVVFLFVAHGAGF